MLPQNEPQSLSNKTDLTEKSYHSLIAIKPKENVAFPKAFDGILGSDVYKFRKEIEEVIDSAQVSEDDVSPGSVRMTGRCWMNKSLKDAKNDGSVKTTEVIRLSYEEKKVVRKEVRYDGQGNDNCLKVCQDPEDEKTRFGVTNWAKDKPDDVLSHDQGHEVAKSSARGDIYPGSTALLSAGSRIL